MKNSDVQIGATYLVKVADNLVPVKLVREHPSGGWEGTSEKTGKTIRIKSAQRLRKRLGDAAHGAAKVEKPTKDARAEPGRDTGERGATGGQPGGDAAATGKAMSLMDAAVHILSLGTGDPMRCKDIVDLVVKRELWTPRTGKTPASTLFARAGVRQPQQVDVGAVVTRIADLAARKHRLKRQGPSERHDRIGVRRDGQRVIHHLADEARHPQHLGGHRAWVGNLWHTRRLSVAQGHCLAEIATPGNVRRTSAGCDGHSHNRRDVHPVGIVRQRIPGVAAVAQQPQRTGGLCPIAAVVQQRVDRERRIGPVGLERIGVGAEDVEDPVLQRGRPARCLAGPSPVFTPPCLATMSLAAFRIV